MGVLQDAYGGIGFAKGLEADWAVAFGFWSGDAGRDVRPLEGWDQGVHGYGLGTGFETVDSGVKGVLEDENMFGEGRWILYRVWLLSQDVGAWDGRGMVSMGRAVPWLGRSTS